METKNWRVMIVDVHDPILGWRVVYRVGYDGPSGWIPVAERRDEGEANLIAAAPRMAAAIRDFFSAKDATLGQIPALRDSLPAPATRKPSVVEGVSAYRSPRRGSTGSPQGGK